MTKTILHVSAECRPWAQTGGLGDAVAGLARAQARAGHEVVVLMPAYRHIVRENAACLGEFAVTAPLPLAQSARLWEANVEERLRVWWLEARCFDRDGGLYVDASGRDWPDNPVRFALLALAAALVAGRWLPEFRADVIHAHDWHAALVPAFQRLLAVRPATTVLTIHNAAFQGWFGHDWFAALGFPALWWQPEVAEAWGQFNYLKTGVMLADGVTTVSPGYARELLAGQFDFGLAGALAQRARAGRFVGILNGIDTDVWDPARDPHLAQRYNADSALQQAKAANRRALLESLGATGPEQGPLVGYVGRLTEQKGVDWLIAALPQLLETTALRFVVLGEGEPRFAEALAALAAQHPQRLWFRRAFNEALAHRIYAGSDFFVMPSRFEPCGLAQLYALRYGAVPVVHAVGGLADTVRDASQPDGTGFVFTEPSADALVATLRRAEALWRDHPRRWTRLMRCGMEEDFGWSRASQAYALFYEELGR